MPAVKYSHNYDYKEPSPRKKKAPVWVNDKQEAIKSKSGAKSKTDKATRLNFILLSVSVVMTVFLVGIYSVVALCEAKLASLHTKISELNYENTELENKLENAKSYYTVDTKVSTSTDFEKAKNVLELNKVDAKMMPHSQPKANNLNTVTGF